MPAGFEMCVREGGRVRTIVPKKGSYLRVCWLNGKSYSGEVKHTKTDAKREIMSNHISKTKK